MKIAEQVTFGAGQLNRAGDIRNDPAKLRALMATARILPVWRGKPMTRHETDTHISLAYLDPTHPAIHAYHDQLVFLGHDDEGPIFGADISDWQMQGDQPDPKVFFDQTAQHHPTTPPDNSFVELRGVMALLSPVEAEIAATARSLLEWHQSHRFCANCGAPSHPAQGGWQRKCHICTRMHFPRTDPVVIMLITHENKVLLGRAPQWPEGMYSLLAGFMEPGETIEAATRREVLEETGIQVGAVEYLASQPWPYPSSLMIGTWGAATSTKIQLDQNELQDAQWLTREDLLDVFAGRNRNIFPARKGSIANFLLANWLADRLD